jgi:2'-5' RNA ligase
MSRIRVFLGVSFPLAVTRRIADEAAALRAEVERAGWKVAWVPAQNLHVTVKFLGMVEAPSVEGIAGRLGRELAARPSFELEARGMGAFPGPLSARVLWVGVKPSPALAALQQDVERWLEETGFPREQRPFHPHVTVGRVKEPGGEPIAPLLAARESAVYGAGRISEIVIYESRTSRSGSEYAALHRIPIGEAGRAEGKRER